MLRRKAYRPTIDDFDTKLILKVDIKIIIFDTMLR